MNESLTDVLAILEPPAHVEDAQAAQLAALMDSVEALNALVQQLRRGLSPEEQAMVDQIRHAVRDRLQAAQIS